MAWEFFLIGMLVGTILSYISLIITIWFLIKTDRGRRILMGIGIAIAADQMIDFFDKKAKSRKNND